MSKTYIYTGMRPVRVRRAIVEPYQTLELDDRERRRFPRRYCIEVTDYCKRVYAMPVERQSAHAKQRGMTLPELLDWCEEHAPAPVADEYAGRQATEEEIALFGQLLDAYDAEDFNGLRATLKALGRKAPGTKAECMDLAEGILRDVFDAEEE
jgi:hypothetical protein